MKILKGENDYSGAKMPSGFQKKGGKFN